MPIHRRTNRLTIKELKAFLEHFPDDAICYGYEGEISGIVVMSLDFAKELGYITNEGEELIHGER